MRIFIDTSALLKKYIQEDGCDSLDDILGQSAEIAVSPVTLIEMNSAISKKLAEKKVSAEDVRYFHQELKRDLEYYFRVIWSPELEEKAVELVRKNSLKSFDAVKLASGVQSDSKFFLTSDEKLFKEAKKVLPRVMLVQ